MTSQKPLALIHLDFEGVGLDSDSELWEVGVIATDEEYTELDAFEMLFEPTLDGIRLVEANPTVLAMHTASGLLDDVRNPSLQKHTVRDAEDRILEMIARFEGAHDIALAGSGVGHFDRRVVAAQMPRFAERLTYWSDDVGVQVRAYKRATKLDILPPLPAKPHRAMSDVRDHLRHARAFREVYLATAVPADENALERALTGLAVLEAFSSHDVFIQGGAQMFTPETAEDMHTLLRTTSHQSIIFGLVDVAATLLREVADVTGHRESSVIARLRSTIVESIASASDSSSTDRA
ncbi:hypothetical protein [Rathayibacter rathayi]|uniref:Uncharacterized protein n=1 Tax=Rathayibacter rathayi TaxID=33887 RepID=A0ABX5AGE3_RATRA|nr:hypothetical protein [Rathayibacter rathayi]PPF23117.1 hypothetical protein C5C34_09820 [Rathayibacter rathayi]PPF51635.1 hypothetical protein C5C08_02180 [Rathayibacter rathayi]PPF83225.1 hypothetical protein C5C14_02215 [Rathayibacter rathayi]PPG14387.1 hypothetical protein C5C11_04950 [Rathayibacter rathayi]PPG47056.1 hypothetical protein C5C20_02175 [Rathayibacter rathayi]